MATLAILEDIMSFNFDIEMGDLEAGSKALHTTVPHIYCSHKKYDRD